MNKRTLVTAFLPLLLLGCDGSQTQQDEDASPLKKKPWELVATAKTPLRWCELDGTPTADKLSVKVRCDGYQDGYISVDTVAVYVNVVPHVVGWKDAYEIPLLAPLADFNTFFDLDLSPHPSRPGFTSAAAEFVQDKHNKTIDPTWTFVPHAVAVHADTKIYQTPINVAGEELPLAEKREPVKVTLDAQAPHHGIFRAVHAWSQIPRLLPNRFPLGTVTDDYLKYPEVYFPVQEGVPSLFIIQGVDKDNVKQDFLFTEHKVFRYTHDGRTEYMMRMPLGQTTQYFIGSYSVWSQAAMADMSFYGEDEKRFRESATAGRPDSRSEIVDLQVLDPGTEAHQFAIDTARAAILEFSRSFRGSFDWRSHYRSKWRLGLVRQALDSSTTAGLSDETVQELGFFWTYLTETSTHLGVNDYDPAAIREVAQKIRDAR